jgi:hypothetical protein
VQVNVTSVGSAATAILVTLPHFAAFRTAAAAVDDNDGTVHMVGKVVGNTLSIIPNAGVISNHLYLAQATYEIA